MECAVEYASRIAVIIGCGCSFAVDRLREIQSLVATLIAAGERLSSLWEYDFNTQGGVYGFALQKTMLEFIHSNSKRAKPDALTSLFSANPCFGDVCDMVRLGDLYTARGDPITTLRRRAQLVRTAMRGKLIDTAGACRFNLAAPIDAVLEEQAKLGVPTIYNAQTVMAHRVFCQPRFRDFTDTDYRGDCTSFRHIWKGQLSQINRVGQVNASAARVKQIEGSMAGFLKEAAPARRRRRGLP